MTHSPRTAIRTTIASLSLFFATTACSGGADPDKVAELVKVSGRLPTAEKMLDKAIRQMEKNPALPPGFGKRFRKAADMKEIQGKIAGILASHLDDETVQAAIDFYTSKAGQSYAEANRQMMDDVADKSMAMGERMARDIVAGREAPTSRPSAAELSEPLRKLMAATKLEAFTKKESEFATGLLRKMPGLEPDFVEKMTKRLFPASLRVTQRAFARHFDDKTAAAATEFFDSPAGRKLIDAHLTAMPTLLKAGAAWGEKCAKKALAGS